MTATVIVGPSRSTCAECGRGADWRAKAHDTIVEYGPDTGKPGCGAVWTHVDSDYTDFSGLYESIKNGRPDLEPTGLILNPLTFGPQS
jgi:hypothetical protein